MRRRALAVVFLIAAAVIVAFAAKGTPLIADFSGSGSGYGVSHDGNPYYSNAVGRVQCYLGVSGQDVDLVTYSSGRKLTFKFDPTSSAWQASGLAQTLGAEVDLYGVNFYGPFQTMGVGTTAQVQTVLEFSANSSTYALSYPSLAAMRTSESTWLITSNAGDIPGYPGFSASSSATLSVKRRRSNQTFGGVTMPIRFTATLK